MAKAAEKKAGGKKMDGLQKPLQPSPELGEIVGTEQLSRADVVSKVWEYIKKNNLQNPENKREIVADEKLVQKGYLPKTQRLFGEWPSAEIAARCQILQAEMLEWAAGVDPARTCRRTHYHGAPLEPAIPEAHAPRQNRPRRGPRAAEPWEGVHAGLQVSRRERQRGHDPYR
jgi:hypothetical protein